MINLDDLMIVEADNQKLRTYVVGIGRVTQIHTQDAEKVDADFTMLDSKDKLQAEVPVINKLNLTYKP